MEKRRKAKAPQAIEDAVIDWGDLPELAGLVMGDDEWREVSRMLCDLGGGLLERSHPGLKRTTDYL